MGKTNWSHQSFSFIFNGALNGCGISLFIDYLFQVLVDIEICVVIIFAIHGLNILDPQDGFLCTIIH